MTASAVCVMGARCVLCVCFKSVRREMSQDEFVNVCESEGGDGDQCDCITSIIS